MNDKHIGVALTGSFCTFSQVIPVIRALAERNSVTAILSRAAAETDTRFYRAEDLRRELEHTWIVDEHGNKRKLRGKGGLKS